MTYTPLFTKIPCDDTAYEKIYKIQKDFERFWSPINEKLKPNAEKTLGMRKLQEACMWLSRSAASGEARKPTGVCAPSKTE